MGFACVKFSKVKKNTEFIALLSGENVINATMYLDPSDLSTLVSMESFYKVANPNPCSYNVVSLATGRQYFVSRKVEVFVYNE